MVHWHVLLDEPSGSSRICITTSALRDDNYKIVARTSEKFSGSSQKFARFSECANALWKLLLWCCIIRGLISQHSRSRVQVIFIGSILHTMLHKEGGWNPLGRPGTPMLHKIEALDATSVAQWGAGVHQCRTGTTTLHENGSLEFTDTALEARCGRESGTGIHQYDAGTAMLHKNAAL